MKKILLSTTVEDEDVDAVVGAAKGLLSAWDCTVVEEASDDSNINLLWKVKPCPCGEPGCGAAIIEPHIVKLQGAMSMDVAEHIVHIHNLWVIGRAMTGRVGPTV